MQKYILVIDEMGMVHILDEDGNDIKENEVRSYLCQSIEIDEIGRGLMQDENIANDPMIVMNLMSIVKNYYVELKAFEEANKYMFLRLALKDTEDDFDENMNKN